jgi:hypothetical protein
MRRAARWLERARERPSSMVAVIVMLLVVAVGIAVLGPAAGRETTSSSDGSRPAAERTRPSTPPSASAPAAPLRPDASQEPPAARAAAQRFLAGYLAYSYGNGPVTEIQAADPRLIAALERQRPRVPPAAQGRKPKVTSLQLLVQGRGTAQATATVADGSGTQYPLVAYLDETASGWVVTRLGDD